MRLCLGVSGTPRKRQGERPTPETWTTTGRPGQRPGRTGRRPEGDGDRGRRRPEAGTRAADLDGVDRQTTRDGRDLGDRGRRQRGELDKPEADQRKGESWNRAQRTKGRPAGCHQRGTERPIRGTIGHHRVRRCPASTIFAGWRQSVLPVHLLGVAPLLGCVGAVAGTSNSRMTE